ncbi:MAG: hypothetical protein Q7K55_06205 [Candidatus Levybacteria bacterium]|nr:hypothetical protein [Candidatus Levybacteria bacterium]
MITIIHGDDTASSRKYFIEQKSNNSISFDGEKLTLTDLFQIFEGGGLFSDSKSLFVDSFFSKRKIGLEFDAIILYLNKINKTDKIFFWEGKELSKKQLSFFKDSNIKIFKLPKPLFQFLDSIKPRNKNTIILFHSGLKYSEPELIFFMLIRQFRLLLALSDEKKGSEIDEVKRLAPWQTGKLKKQSNLFSHDKLKKIYKRLYEIDLGHKTGNLNMSLIQAIDILLLEI